MKKNIYNILLAGTMAATLVACTDNMGDNSPAISQETYQELATPSDQAISVSTGTRTSGVASKAPINSTSEGYFETDTIISTFMLATGYTDTYKAQDAAAQKVLAIDWIKHYSGSISRQAFVDNWMNYYMKGTNLWSVYYDLDDVTTKAVYTKDDTGKITGTSLVWRDGEARYYPMGNYHTYGFYAYAPDKDKTSKTPNKHFPVNYTTNYLSTTITGLDGTKDIIWGHATQADFDASKQCNTKSYNISSEREAELKAMAYSAKFYRQAENRDDQQPSVALSTPMKFEHKLMKFSFFITPGRERATSSNSNPAVTATREDYKNGCDTRVDSIVIINAPKQVTLYIADKSTSGNQEGKIVIPDTPSREYNLYYLKDSLRNEAGELEVDLPLKAKYPKMKSDDPTSADYATPDTISLGQSIMLPPLTEAQEAKLPYRLMVVVSYPDPDSTTGALRKHRLIYPLKLSASTGYNAGSEYRYVLSIFRPEEMTLTATLADWDTGVGKDHEVDIPLY